MAESAPYLKLVLSLRLPSSSSEAFRLATREAARELVADPAREDWPDAWRERALREMVLPLSSA